MQEISKRFDVRKYKKDLRDRFKKIRAEIPAQKKLEKDERILSRVMKLPEYARAKTVLCYVSTQTEVNTHKLIELAIADGKTVAVPYCVDGTRDILFYQIHSLSQLSSRTFGVLEPNPQTSRLIENFKDSICILPGLAFDMAGFRLGYGGGYYDRFLSQKYTGTTVGISYSECCITAIRHGRYDIGCNLLVTDLFLKRMAKQV